MSRSYKKNPWCCCPRNGMKKVANHTIRTGRSKNKDIPSGNAYKKYFCSYDICDYKFYFTYKDLCKREHNPYYNNISENYWKKTYMRK